MIYAYKAMNHGGRIATGELDATNLADLEARLQLMGLDLIDGRPVRDRKLRVRGTVSRRELINFCFHLEQLTRAGVPVVDGLIDLRDSVDNPRLRGVLVDIVERVKGGKTLSQAIQEHPGVFDRTFASLIRAGESTGNLCHVLNSLSESLKWQDELAAHTRKLAMYPAFMGSAIVAAVFFMMIYLVPKMQGFITNTGQQIPFQTRVLIWTSNLFVHHWTLMLLVPAVAVCSVVFLVRIDPNARRSVDALKLRIPVSGNILRRIILSRFTGVFALMYASRIPVLDSIRIAEDVAGNEIIRAGLIEAGRQIADGRNLAAAFQNTGLFPPLVIRMLRVGESTGGLDDALSNVSYFYNRDVKEAIERIQAMIEPVMTIAMGLLLGWVMLSVLGPVYDTISRMKY